MAGPFKTVLYAYLVLKVLEFLGIEFDDLAANVTDHMIMMSMAISMFVDITFLCSRDPFDETALHK